jgi:hypothetical protein
MASRGEATPSDVAGPRGLSHTAENRKAIRRQLRRVLESPLFRTSKRYPAFLSHVVEKTLQGSTDVLKERTLGVEVFHRDPLYDTNADPVVRVAAGEVRKRLAQYYFDVAHRSEIRIELAPGSYVPEFYGPAEEKAPANHNAGNPEKEEPAERASGISPQSAERRLDQPRGNRWHVLVPMLCAIVGFVTGAAAIRVRRAVASAPPTGLDEFWSPLTSAPGAVWLCVGQSYVTQIALDPNGARAGSGSPLDAPYFLTSDDQKVYPALNLADSTVLARVAGVLQKQNKNYSVHDEAETTFSDLANGPSVLIGSFNNDWTIRLSDRLRFHFQMDRDAGEQWIVDREKPNEKIGLRPSNLRAPDARDAYAIISRVRDASTGQMVVILAGLSTDGTQAAGAFVSEPRYLEEFARRAPRNWQNANLQIVIAAPIVDGSLGPPHIVSSYVW